VPSLLFALSSFPLALAAVSLAIWIVLTFFRGAFWQLRQFDDDLVAPVPPKVWPQIAVILPARNEAESIARTLEALGAQEYPGELQVFTVDDHSQDETAAEARRVVQERGFGERVTILQAKPLQPGWTGKLWGMQQGVEAAAAFAPDYFWFTDADIVHAPDTLVRLVSRAENERRDLVSLMVLLQAKTLPERLLIPPFLYFFLKLYPPRWIADPKARTAGAAGGCVLMRRSALERMGGLSAIRSEVIDDCSLARAGKRMGGAIWMGLTRKSVSLRAYDSFAEIRDLIARTAFTQLEYSLLLLLGTILGMFLTYIVPVVLVFHTEPMVWRVSFVAWALMTVTYLPTVRFYKLSALWALTLPAAAAFYSYATGLSAVRYWLGRGGQWKGRAQAPVKPS
jgi:hopene-associated glycosyltransferase HpnB